MEQKTLGIDLGTNSLGLTLRNLENGGDIANQLEYYSVNIFKSGVGTDNRGEYSYAADRTKHRSSRRLYQSRKYRIWATLKLLIKYGCCPLRMEELEKWSRYDKTKGMKRQYPNGAIEFERWVRLDFDGNGIADYSSPYQLRAELMNRELNWNNQKDRYLFGRAMYHIAQRRGFKSSKGETLKDAGDDKDVDNILIDKAMKASEIKKSKGINDYMQQHGFKTVGCAFANLEKEGIRVRNHSEYQAVQSDLIKEVDKICKHQHIDSIEPELYKGLVSTKQGIGTIFYRRPLRSQKGNIGKCLLEPTKRRCPVSHPDYEEYRALAFINNIKYRLTSEDTWHSLTEDERMRLFNNRFTLARSTFKFEEIHSWIEKELTHSHIDYNEGTINYRDYTTVPGCPVISRLKKLLGDNWRTATIETTHEHINHKSGEVHNSTYNYEDLWHLAFCSDDYEELSEFVQKRLAFDTKQSGEIVRLWSAIQQGYTTLSIKAIRNILPFLRRGMSYSDAVAVAKIPDIIGHERWKANSDIIISALDDLTATTNHTRTVYSIVNKLISNYKSLPFEDQFAYKDINYQLTSNDEADIDHSLNDTLGTRRINKMSDNAKNALRKEISILYQQFFASSKRDYYKLPKQSDTLREYLSKLFPDIEISKWYQLYHHSQTNPFPHAKTDKNGVLQLGTPDIGSIKNPVALRALHVLRRNINAMLKEGMIDEDTRIVVETARKMHDANWRRAIDQYQKEREKENDAIIAVIKEFRPNYTDVDIEKGRLLFEQNIVQHASHEEIAKAEKFADYMKRYRLWKEQNFKCLYTGKTIGLTELFNENIVDIEHTIPRSISFDDSLSNKTVCISHFNRFEKSNRIPSELTNHEDILQRIKPWQERVEHIMSQIELWRGNARKATTKERKDECLQQMHQWELERDYWQAKVRTFTIQKDELDLGFRNSQLVDTRIITKYAFHYLKSLFSHVDVEKGAVTDAFRKILGVQSVNVKKDRSKHSHHAIDAAILTLIPPAAQRDKMLQLFYQIEEASDSDKEVLRATLQREIRNCHIGSVNGLRETIESNILINHISKDQTLAPAKKPLYKGQKRVEGQWATGDSIRGSLHKDTFYGAIKSGKDIMMVVRKSLNQGAINPLKENDIDSIIDPKVRDIIQKHRLRMKEKRVSFAKAMEEPIYMLNKDGEPITNDRNGRPIAPIRHVRCYAKAGRGFLKTDTALIIKQQTYQSKYKYKNFYYAQNDDNYLCLYYEGTLKGKQHREFRLINYLDVAHLNLKSTNFLFSEPEFAFLNGHNTMPLKAIIKKGTRIIPYSIYPEEVNDLDTIELSKRLFVVYKFNEIGTPSLYLKHHLEARKDTECNNTEKSTSFNPHIQLSYLTLKASNFKALIENYDFEVDSLGNIHFE